MNWLDGQKIEWETPLTFASRFRDADMALLYSGLRDQSSGESSCLAIDPIQTIEGSNWQTLHDALATSHASLPDWFGHVGYGMREQPLRSAMTIAPLPDFRLTRYRHLFHFDHRTRTLTHYRREGSPPLALPAPTPAPTLPAATKLTSPTSRDSYLRMVGATLAQIQAGNFYQANITRKFHGSFTGDAQPLALFTRLTEASPAAYSAYIRHGDTAILSSSPECFLEITPAGAITSRPIKGSARRMADEATDARAQAALVASEKNQAENLMIVDLMRNDLGRVSSAGSVEVAARSALHSYATIHHLISTVRAKKRPGVSIGEVVRACFPPGSMTGAPKIAAIDWCTAQEPMERGVYSGAIGWFSGDACALSVVIRTLVIEGNRFEFQVGGGIVADSDPEDEWRETLAKARGLCACLGIAEETLAAL